MNFGESASSVSPGWRLWLEKVESSKFLSFDSPSTVKQDKPSSLCILPMRDVRFVCLVDSLSSQLMTEKVKETGEQAVSQRGTEQLVETITLLFPGVLHITFLESLSADKTCGTLR